MKKIAILSITLLCGMSIEAQTYRNAFDTYNNSIGPESSPPGQGTSMLANCTIEVSAFEPAYLRGYLDMFKATKDKKYLDQFAVHVQRIMDRRDDHIGTVFSPATAASLGFPFTRDAASGCNITDVSTIVNENALSPRRCWSHVGPGCRYDEIETAQDGALLYPMAEFLYLVSSDNDFITMLPDTLPGEVQHSSETGARTYEQFANWLTTKVYESVEWYNKTAWVSFKIDDPCKGKITSSGYFNDNVSTEITVGQVNMQAAMGSVLIWLEQLAAVHSQFARQPLGHYQGRYLSQVAADIKAQLVSNPC